MKMAVPNCSTAARRGRVSRCNAARMKKAGQLTLTGFLLGVPLSGAAAADRSAC